MKSITGMTIMLRLIRNCWSNCEIYKTESPNIFVFSSTFCSFVNHNMYKGMKYKMEPSTSLPVYFIFLSNQTKGQFDGSFKIIHLYLYTYFACVKITIYIRYIYHAIVIVEYVFVYKNLQFLIVKFKWAYLSEFLSPRELRNIC